jgi:uncharacterized protein YeeX (DUF496 family)
MSQGSEEQDRQCEIQDITNELESIFSGIVVELTREPMSMKEQERQRISDIIIDLESLSLKTISLTRKLKQLQKEGEHKAKPTGMTYHNYPSAK